MPNKMAAIRLFMITVFLTVAETKAEILYAETATLSFEAWAADLNPGYTIRQTNIEGRTCYCKGATIQNPQGANPSAAMEPSSSYMFGKPPATGSQGLLQSSFEYIFMQPTEDRRQHRRV